MMRIRILIVVLFLFSTTARADFLSEFPELRRHVKITNDSPLRFGVGAGFIGFLPSKALHTINIFQAHYVRNWLDIELLSASLGLSSFVKDSFAGSRHFILRTIPKVRVFDFLSVGPLFGFEWVSFPGVSAVLTQNGFQTPQEPFSSQGLIYGAAISETFSLGESYSLQVSQLGFVQTYRADIASNGWQYAFQDTALQADPERNTVKAAFVFLLEASLLF